MTGDGYVGDGSPDRCDAAVWALSELMILEKGAFCINTFIKAYS